MYSFSLTERNPESMNMQKFNFWTSDVSYFTVKSVFSVSALEVSALVEVACWTTVGLQTSCNPSSYQNDRLSVSNHSQNDIYDRKLPLETGAPDLRRCGNNNKRLVRLRHQNDLFKLRYVRDVSWVSQHWRDTCLTFPSTTTCSLHGLCRCPNN